MGLLTWQIGYTAHRARLRARNADQKVRAPGGRREDLPRRTKSLVICLAMLGVRLRLFGANDAPARQEGRFGKRASL